MELQFQTCQSLPIPELRMRWKSGVADIEIGDKLLLGGFDLDVSGSGTDRLLYLIACHSKGNSIVGPGIPLSYGLSTRAVQQGHSSTQECADSLPARGARAVDMGSRSLPGLEADFPDAPIESGQPRFHIIRYPGNVSRRSSPLPQSGAHL